MIVLALGALAVAAGSLALWDPLDIDERRHVRRVSLQAARFVRAELIADLQVRLAALVRLASECASADEASQRCDNMESRLIAPDDTGVRSIRWIEGAGSRRSKPLRLATQEPGAFDSDVELQSALKQLVEHEPAAPVLLPGALSYSNQIRIVVPAVRADRTAGFLIAVIDTTAAFRAMLARHDRSGFVISVDGDSREIYRTSGSAAAGEMFVQQLPLDFLGSRWTIRAWPDTDTLLANRSTLPELALILGALLGLLVMLASTSVHQAHRKAAESRRMQQELVATVVRSQDQERRRLAREMHDSTAQTLSMVAMTLDGVRHQLHLRGDRRQADELSEAGKLLDGALLEIRTMSYLLHPPLLDELGLGHAVTWFVEGLRRRAGMDVQLEIDSNLPRLAPDAELTLFRVAQEALTNVHRHSGSHTAKVRLFGDSRVVTLEVIDHGRGMTKELAGQTREKFRHVGVGLTGMRECIHELGGRFELQSTEDGTSVSAALPVAIARLRRSDRSLSMTTQVAS